LEKTEALNGIYGNHLQKWYFSSNFFYFHNKRAPGTATNILEGGTYYLRGKTIIFLRKFFFENLSPKFFRGSMNLADTLSFSRLGEEIIIEGTAYQRKRERALPNLLRSINLAYKNRGYLRLLDFSGIAEYAFVEVYKDTLTYLEFFTREIGTFREVGPGKVTFYVKVVQKRGETFSFPVKQEIFLDQVTDDLFVGVDNIFQRRYVARIWRKIR